MSLLLKDIEYMRGVNQLVMEMIPPEHRIVLQQTQADAQSLQESLGKALWDRGGKQFFLSYFFHQCQQPDVERAIKWMAYWGELVDQADKHPV